MPKGAAMKFNLSTLFLLVALAATVCGWAITHMSNARKVESLKSEHRAALQNAEELSSHWKSALITDSSVATRIGFAGSHRRFPNDTTDLIRRQICTAVYDLWCARSHFEPTVNTLYRGNKLYMRTNKCLSILGCKSPDEYFELGRQLYPTNAVWVEDVNEIPAPLRWQTRTDHTGFRAFVLESLKEEHVN